MDAIHCAINGDSTAADQFLDKHANAAHPVALSGVLQLLRMKNKWAEILALCEKQAVQRLMRNVPVFAVYRLRALFETGRLHEAFQYYLHLKKHMSPSALPRSSPSCLTNPDVKKTGGELKFEQ